MGGEPFAICSVNGQLHTFGVFVLITVVRWDKARCTAICWCVRGMPGSSTA